MNKQELFEKIEGLNRLYGEAKNYVVVDDVLNLVKLLDEPQKVVIPKLVADWLEYCKNIFLSLARALAVSEEDFYNYANQEDHSKIIIFLESEINQDRFARAWLDGYRIEKEKRYLVKMKGVNEECECLYYGTISNTWKFEEKGENGYFRKNHTRKELEEAGFGEVFNSSLFEVEETK